ncbi:MAG: hypothetical protein PVI23_15830 [Maricaulaceae bacterium]|jgi:hypothetical protein
MTMQTPLFIVLEPPANDAGAAVSGLCWACETEAGAARGRSSGEAAETIAALSKTHPPFSLDPLFDAPRLAAFMAAHGQTLGQQPRDWMLALAPFGQARNLAAILEAAEARADGDPARRLLEAWREAKARAEKA